MNTASRCTGWDAALYREMKAAGELPRVGDTVRSNSIAMEGKVVETFYQNGEGGMHVSYPDGCHWTCSTSVTVIRRSAPTQ